MLVLSLYEYGYAFVDRYAKCTGSIKCCKPNWGKISHTHNSAEAKHQSKIFLNAVVCCSQHFAPDFADYHLGSWGLLDTRKKPSKSPEEMKKGHVNKVR